MISRFQVPSFKLSAGLWVFATLRAMISRRDAKNAKENLKLET